MFRPILMGLAALCLVSPGAAAPPRRAASKPTPKAKHAAPVRRPPVPNVVNVFPAAPPPIVILPSAPPPAYPYVYTRPPVVSGPTPTLPPRTYGGGGGTVIAPIGGSFGAPPVAGGSFGGGRPMGGSFGDGRRH